jgi:general secretion pathway protein G
MNLLNKRRRERRGGFTLIEILVVIAILGLLVTFVGPELLSLFGGAQADMAQNTVLEIEKGLELFLIKSKDKNPTIEKLVTPDDKGQAYMKTHDGQPPKDPWDSPYEIIQGSRPGTWIVRSWGPDKTPDTDDDILSKKQT